MTSFPLVISFVPNGGFSPMIVASPKSSAMLLFPELSEDSNSGPSLVPNGGTLGPTGYSFGPNTGLRLDNVVSQTYSIYISFNFDSVAASYNGYQRILDFSNRLSDSGLYSSGGRLSLFPSSYLPGLPPVVGGNYPSASSAGQVFTNGVAANLLVTRDATGLFSAYVNGGLAFSAMDPTGATTFSGLNNRIWFFVDDFQSLYFYPDTPEAGSGFIDFIQVSSTPISAVPGPAAGAGLPGLIFLIVAWWLRKRKAAAAIAA